MKVAHMYQIYLLISCSVLETILNEKMFSNSHKDEMISIKKVIFKGKLLEIYSFPCQIGGTSNMQTYNIFPHIFIQMCVPWSHIASSILDGVPWGVHFSVVFCLLVLVVSALIFIKFVEWTNIIPCPHHLVHLCDNQWTSF